MTNTANEQTVRELIEKFSCSSGICLIKQYETYNEQYYFDSKNEIPETMLNNVVIMYWVSHVHEDTIVIATYGNHKNKNDVEARTAEEIMMDMQDLIYEFFDTLED